MKTIGLLCGLSWVSTKIYYEIINRRISQQLNGCNSAHIIMNSLNADSVITLLQNNRLKKLETMLIKECLKLEKAGCDFIAITCNSVHAFYNSIKDSLNIPVIHIMDSVTSSLVDNKITNAGILGTEFTIENKLYDKYLTPIGINSIYPNKNEIKIIDNIIFKICSGQAPNSQDIKSVKMICERLKNEGSDAIILGCTELGLVLDDENDPAIFNSAVIHSEDLAFHALSGKTISKENCSSKWYRSGPIIDISYA